MNTFRILKQTKERMKEVQNNIDMYNAILNMPPRLKEKQNLEISHSTTIDNIKQTLHYGKS